MARHGLFKGEPRLGEDHRKTKHVLFTDQIEDNANIF